MKNKKWLWVANATLTTPTDSIGMYTYRTHPFYGTEAQVNLDMIPLIEQTLNACNYFVYEWKLEREDIQPDSCKFIKGVTGHIVQK
jgi:hypothetical protein